jgi:hypothetical protein
MTLLGDRPRRRSDLYRVTTPIEPYPGSLNSFADSVGTAVGPNAPTRATTATVRSWALRRVALSLAKNCSIGLGGRVRRQEQVPCPDRTAGGELASADLKPNQPNPDANSDDWRYRHSPWANFGPKTVCQRRPLKFKSLKILVGARGFEPPTPSPPDWKTAFHSAQHVLALSAFVSAFQSTVRHTRKSALVTAGPLYVPLMSLYIPSSP